MIRKSLTLSSLAVFFPTPLVHAQTGAAQAQGTAPAVDSGAIQVLQDMVASLQALKRVGASIEHTGELVLADGQKPQLAASVVMDVERPKKLRVWISSARSAREPSAASHESIHQRRTPAR